MKILIIEDDRYFAKAIKGLITELGEIEICTQSEGPREMPRKEEVISSIQAADLILLDHMLGDNFIGEEYKGKEFLPYCIGKKVISISSSFDFGDATWGYKQYMDRPEAAPELKKIIAELMQ